MTSTVRRLGVADWEQLRDVRLRALQDSPSAFLKSYEEESEYGADRWRTWFSDRTVVFTAERDGSTIGMICGIPAGEDERDPDAAMMVAMWTDPAVRGSGVAVALTDELVAWAKESGYLRLVLWVYDVNPRAAAFYRRYGFVPTGRAETFHDDPRVLRLLTLDL
jgi:GNAT superfamily N-acetyltransferase